VTHTRRTPLYDAIDRWTLPHYERVIAVSQDLYDQCVEAGVPKQRLHLIENAIDTDEFARTMPPAAAPGRTDVPPGRLVVGAVGRLRDEKGFDLLIPAFATLLKEGYDLELWIAGEGPEREPLTAQAAATGFGERIRFLGYQGNTRDLFAAFDLFCLSSRREGLPNVMLEAMAMDVAVVATDCGGIAAFGHDGEDMIIVPTESIEALTNAMRSLIRDPARRAALAAAGRRRVEDEFSFRRRMERIVAVYDDLMAP
jgi:glycosyltransferase involved in cell wall biosynthesis